VATRREMMAALKTKGISWERGSFPADDVLLLQYTKYVVEEQKPGDCYEVHAKAIIDGLLPGMLCHGTVWHQETGWHGHCWIEVNDDVVLDFSNGHQVIVRRDAYYELGKVKNVKRYNPEQARELMEKEGTYGEWETVGSADKEPKLEKLDKGGYIVAKTQEAMVAHTGGTWQVNETAKHDFEITNELGILIASGMRWYNAYFIAAAPEQHDALVAIDRWLIKHPDVSDDPWLHGLHLQIQNAIAKGTRV